MIQPGRVRTRPISDCCVLLHCCTISISLAIEETSNSLSLAIRDTAVTGHTRSIHWSLTGLLRPYRTKLCFHQVTGTKYDLQLAGDCLSMSILNPTPDRQCPKAQPSELLNNGRGYCLKLSVQGSVMQRSDQCFKCLAGSATAITAEGLMAATCQQEYKENRKSRERRPEILTTSWILISFSKPDQPH